MAIDLTKAFTTDKDKTGFPTALYSTNAAKIMAFAEQIYDLNQDKFQATINDEIYTKIDELGDNEKTISASLNGLNDKINDVSGELEEEISKPIGEDNLTDELKTKINGLIDTDKQIKNTIEENEETVSAALNDLNERIANTNHPIEGIADNSKGLLNIADSKLEVKIGDLFDIADMLDDDSDSDFVLDSDFGLCEAGNVYNYIRSIMGKLDNSETIKQIKNTIEENEETVAAALNDLNKRIVNFKVEELTNDDVDEIINDIFI